MAVLILVIFLCALSSYFIARAVYKINIKNKVKNPMVAPVIIFIFTLAIFLFGIFLLLGSMFRR